MKTIVGEKSVIESSQLSKIFCGVCGKIESYHLSERNLKFCSHFIIRCNAKKTIKRQSCFNNLLKTNHLNVQYDTSVDKVQEQGYESGSGRIQWLLAGSEFGKNLTESGSRTNIFISH